MKWRRLRALGLAASWAADRKASRELGMVCPKCGHFIDSDDCWAGSICLRCALKEEEGQK